MSRIALVLLHHPVLNRAGEVATSGITSVDLHDIARSAHTYGVQALYIVHPVAAQRALAARIREHWVGGPGERRIPDRRAPLELLRVVESLGQAIDHWAGAEEQAELWVTSAREATSPLLGWSEARERLERGVNPVLIAFGTGWGLGPAVYEQSAYRLPAIESPRADRYNHLSVRAAAAIILDRLLAPSGIAATDSEHGSPRR